MFPSINFSINRFFSKQLHTYLIYSRISPRCAGITFLHASYSGIGRVSKDTDEIRQLTTASSVITYAEKCKLNAVDFMECSHEHLLGELSQYFTVYANFISQDEEELICKELQRQLKRMRYQYDHWDNAIHGYREFEKKEWSDSSAQILQRVQNIAFPPAAAQMALVHVLDLDKLGHIKAHIDSVKFCGDTIAGLSLLSSAIMQLVLDKDHSYFVKCLLPQRSLYIMTGIARYNYTHEVLKQEQSVFRNEPINKDRRISVICRSEPRS